MILPAHETVLTLSNLESIAPTEASSHVQSDLMEIMDLWGQHCTLPSCPAFSAVVLKLGGRHENRSQDIDGSSA
jgi:hypothetical protein